LPDIGALPSLSSGIADTTPWHSEVPPVSDTLFQDPWSKTSDESKSAENTFETSGHRYNHSANSIDVGIPFGLGNKQNQERRKKGHSQKAMLSKALQKANTAVLLDNAANFEGAMEAYNDACQLLQLVMLRSNGGEDEKMKLQEIVSLSPHLFVTTAKLN
jgi:hypothetical protein